MMKSFILAATSIACFLTIVDTNIKSEASPLDVTYEANSQPSQVDVKNIHQAINEYYIKENQKSNPNNPANYNRSADLDPLQANGKALFSEANTMKLIEFKSSKSTKDKAARVEIDAVGRRYRFASKKESIKYPSMYNGFFATKDPKDNYRWKLDEEMILKGTLSVEKRGDKKWVVVGESMGVGSIKTFK
jgi:hypothetical protein